MTKQEFFQSKGLTTTEIEIADAVLRGESNKTIAEARGVPEGKIKRFVSMVYTKVGIHSRNEFIAIVGKMPTDFDADVCDKIEA